MNKEIVISEQELARQARKLLEGSTLSEFKVTEYPDNEIFDLAVKVSLGGVECDFLADCQLRPSVRDVSQLSTQELPKNKKPILVTVKLTPSLVDECRKHGVSCLDLNGRIWISAKGLVIDRDVPTSGKRRLPRATDSVSEAFGGLSDLEDLIANMEE